MIRIFQFLALSNMPYVQDDIIFPLMKWMPYMPVQWCTSFSSVTEDSMATTHPVLQASGNKPHPCIFMASFSKKLSSIHYCSFIFLLQYISQAIDVLHLFKRDQWLCRSLPIVLSESTSSFSFLRIEVTPDFIELILYKSSIRLKLICVCFLHIQFAQWIIIYNTVRISWGWSGLDGTIHDQ